MQSDHDALGKNRDYFLVIHLHDFYKPLPHLPELAAMVGMSLASFKIKFKEKYSQPPYHYYLSKKMAYAVQMLENGGYRVREVAQLLGYSQPTKFIQSFKSQLGYLPSVCRNKYKASLVKK